jgi:predicted ATPase
VERFVVVTGGPGAGKTTLLSVLRSLGYAVTADVARALIQADPRVRDDEVAFQDAILRGEVAAYAAALASSSGTVFFDRAVPDVAASYVLCGLAVPAHVDAAVREHPYATRVFVAPPWPEIYVNDAERVQPYEHAVRVHAAIVETYGRYGYDLVPLPLASVEARVAFVTSGRAGPRGEPALP